jgi:hypothetical protein
VLRVDPPTAPGARERVRARLEAVIPAMTGGLGGGATGTGPPPPVTAVTFGSRTAQLIVAFVAGGAVGVALYSSLSTVPAPRVVYVDRPIADAAPVATADSSEVAKSTLALPQPSAVSAARPPASSKTGPSQLSAERVILDEARAALVREDAPRALRDLDRHRRMFPNALLGDERDALQVQALVKSERYDEARSLAAAFRRRAPDSLFIPMVEAAIASIP